MKKTLYDKQVEEWIKQLTIEGEKVIKNAYEARGFQNRTYNLHDSYGSAVYQDGRLLKHTIRYVGSAVATKGVKKRSISGEAELKGREEVDKFFSEYKPTTTKGLELIVIAAMYYAGFVEGKNYHVIANAETGLQNIAKNFPNARVEHLSVKR